MDYRTKVFYKRKYLSALSTICNFIYESPVLSKDKRRAVVAVLRYGECWAPDCINGKGCCFSEKNYQNTRLALTRILGDKLINCGQKNSEIRKAINTVAFLGTWVSQNPNRMQNSFEDFMLQIVPEDVFVSPKFCASDIIISKLQKKWGKNKISDLMCMKRGDFYKKYKEK